MTDWVQSVWPVAAFFLGGLSKHATDVLQRRHAEKQGKAARLDQRFDRREAFELSTLTDLHTAIGELARAAGKAHHADVMISKQTGSYASTLLPEGVSEEQRLANQRVHALSSLVLIEEIRTAVTTAQTLINRPSGMHKSDPKVAERAFNDGAVAVDAAQEAVAARIREIYLTHKSAT